MSEAWSELHERLLQADWFSSVGQPLVTAVRIARVETWDEAMHWCVNPISRWCNVEGKKSLYEQLSKSHYQQFITWNNVAKAVLPEVQQIIATKVVRAAPNNFTIEGQNWIQSQLLSAYLECHFGHLVNVTQFRNHAEFYLSGYFPCGWQVRSEDEFPDQVVTLIL